ncbi:hypothetical protein EL78_3941 [Escherichia coli]|nr:hypothetical protein EL78_3941 [Escherichia coli]
MTFFLTKKIKAKIQQLKKIAAIIPCQMGWIAAIKIQRGAAHIRGEQNVIY